MRQDKSLGEVVREITALTNLMAYIEERSASIYVRDVVNGELGTYSLEDLPTPQALHWSFWLIRNSRIPISNISQQAKVRPAGTHRRRIRRGSTRLGNATQGKQKMKQENDL